MEDLIFLIFCLLSIIDIKIKGFNQYFNDYMELKNTNAIKGIFVWMIVLSHYRGYYKSNKIYIYRTILNYLGQKMVSLFLFYSGFGIYESIKNKGIKYIRTLPRKIIILFIKTQIIIFIFFLNNLLLGIKTKLKNYFLSIIFISSIGNSNWFAFTIISFYFYAFISFIFIKNEKKFFLGILIITIINFFHVFFVYNYFYPKMRFTIDNTLCFIIGLYYSLFKKYFDKIIMKNDIIYIGNISFFILIYYYYYVYQKKTVLIVSITNSIFCLIIVIISMKIRFNNEFLNLLNSHSFSIYLLQRVVMRFIYFKKFFKNNEFIRFFFEFTTILFISLLFDNYTSFIDKYFKNTNQNKHNFFNKNEESLIIINNK